VSDGGGRGGGDGLWCDGGLGGCWWLRGSCGAVEGGGLVESMRTHVRSHLQS